MTLTGSAANWNYPYRASISADSFDGEFSGALLNNEAEFAISDRTGVAVVECRILRRPGFWTLMSIPDFSLFDRSGNCPPVVLKRVGLRSEKLTWGDFEAVFRLFKARERITSLGVDLRLTRTSFEAICDGDTPKLAVPMLIGVLYFAWVQFSMQEES